VRPILKTGLLLAALCFTGSTLAGLAAKAPPQLTWTSLSAGGPCDPLSTQLKSALTDQASSEQRISADRSAAPSQDAFASLAPGFNSKAAPQTSLSRFRPDVPIRLRQRPPPLS
jgi:TRAP-type uncharacterized transport system substrate-binding protein